MKKASLTISLILVFTILMNAPVAAYTTNAVDEDSAGASVDNDLVNYSNGVVLTIGSPRMFVQGSELDIDPGFETTPVIINGSTFVPIRAVIENLGGTVSWWAADQSTTINLDGISIVIKTGNDTVMVNGIQKEISEKPFVSATGRTMLPLRFISENLEHQINWDASTQTISIE